MSTETRKRLRISIRYKMLLVISAVLLVAMGTYLYLATTLFARDKLAYIYDLNSSLVSTLSEQTRSSLGVLVKELTLVAASSRSRSERRSRARELFTHEPDVLRVEVFEGVGAGGSYTGRELYLNPAGLERTEISDDDLDLARRERPIPLQAVASEEGYLYVQNSSLPPDAAILTIAFRLGEGVVLSADFRHERLLRIFGQSKLHETYLVDERGEILAHPDAKLVIERADRSKHALVAAALGGKIAQGVTEFDHEGTDYLGAYAKVGTGKLWVFTQLSRAEALTAGRELIERSVLFAIAILFAAVLVSIFFSRYLAAPIQRLRGATEVIGQGKFDVNVQVKSRDEIGDLAEAFNSMAGALKNTQAQLIQSEKMAAFGQLGAGITHEVKNPMTGIIGFAQLAQRKLDNPEKVGELLKLIEKEGLRCRDILVNFLKFARTGGGDFERIDLNAVVEESGQMLRHQLGINNVKLQINLGEQIPDVLGSGSELKQVLLNLGMNAQQAMGTGGKVVLETQPEDGGAVILVTDTGPGIPEDIRSKIFEPFFTTKKSGEGTGLGLSVSFGIVRAHQGRLEVESQLGAGTTFKIHLPSAADAPAKPGREEKTSVA